MKKILMIFLVLMIFKSQSVAQNYLTSGVGFSGTFYNSEDLDLFTETYNLTNSPNLAILMEGFGGAEGIRWEIGYRYFNHLSAAVSVGLQNYIRRDFARYNNGESRNLKLKTSSIYVEHQLGRTRKNSFFNGVLTVFFNRKFTLESIYFGESYESSNVTNLLDGNYKSSTSFSIDLGVAAGIFKKPIFLTAKITYPLFTRGESEVLQDKSAEKISEGSDIFPNDFASHARGDPYKGISNNIDGLKISLTIDIAIPLKR